jgi:hypothetical protein
VSAKVASIEFALVAAKAQTETQTQVENKQQIHAVIVRTWSLDSDSRVLSDKAAKTYLGQKARVPNTRRP